MDLDVNVAGFYACWVTLDYLRIQAREREGAGGGGQICLTRKSMQSFG